MSTALLRQEASLSFVKREQWTEEQILSLPSGEHDYFDRKGGQLFDPPIDSNNLYNMLAKEVSAFANSGGGHLILGVQDDGTIDGVPPVVSGKTSTREWLEQKLPDLLEYRLVDFRVHTVSPAARSVIPLGREIIVVDIGDSALAPHQSRRHRQYFYRSGSHSIQAPHFYLELLRQRLTNASLNFKVLSVKPEQAWLHEETVILRVDAGFLIENTGRVAAYKWSLVPQHLNNVPNDRSSDYFFGPIPGSPGRPSSIRVDDTILPGGSLREIITFGVRLRPVVNNEPGFRDDLLKMFGTMLLTLRLATETSPGESKSVDVGAVFPTEEALDLLRNKKLVAA